MFSFGYLGDLIIEVFFGGHDQVWEMIKIVIIYNLYIVMLGFGKGILIVVVLCTIF